MVTTVRSCVVQVPRWIVPIHEDAEGPTFGEVLRRERLARGWSQDYVAAAVGVRQGKISAYENDRVNDPPAVVVAALEDLFGLERGNLAVLLWGERVRDEFRRLMSPSNTFVLTDDSPESLREIIGEISALDEVELQKLREDIRSRWVARRESQKRPPLPFRNDPNS